MAAGTPVKIVDADDTDVAYFAAEDSSTAEECCSLWNASRGQTRWARPFRVEPQESGS